jgi:hypothetical protein
MQSGRRCKKQKKARILVSASAPAGGIFLAMTLKRADPGDQSCREDSGNCPGLLQCEEQLRFAIEVGVEGQHNRQ